MRIHVCGLPHTETTATYCSCAYTGKILKFSTMMYREGHEVFLYAGAENEAECSEHIPLISAHERKGWFGEWDAAALPTITWDPYKDEWWRTMNNRAIREIRRRAEPQDIVCLTAGLAQKPIWDAFPTLTCCESGVGYEGIFTNRCAFESYAWKHWLYGKYAINDGRWFDTVIPNYFDPKDFVTRKKPEDYLLFIGRLVQRKGPHVAAQIAAELDMPLLVAGAGATSHTKGRIVAPEIVIEGPGVEYVGAVGVKERAKLMAGARAILAPTLYIEPFGGVTVEGFFTGTPAVTTDWGVFPETVREGLSGARFNSLADGCEAVERAMLLDRAKIKKYANETYSLDAVGPRFTRWFEHLLTLWDEGWYAQRVSLQHSHRVMAGIQH